MTAQLRLDLDSESLVASLQPVFHRCPLLSRARHASFANTLAIGFGQFVSRRYVRAADAELRGLGRNGSGSCREL
jgi:hypothetical protein